MHMICIQHNNILLQQVMHAQKHIYEHSKVKSFQNILVHYESNQTVQESATQTMSSKCKQNKLS